MRSRHEGDAESAGHDPNPAHLNEYMYEQLFARLNHSATLVAANHRLARTLKHQYDRMQIAAGQEAWPAPDILSWQDWLRRLWEESRLRGGSATRLRLISETEAAVLWEQVVGNEADASSAVGELAGQAADAWRLACDWDILGAPEWATTGLSPDQQLFVRWSGQFRDTCSSNNLIDHARLAGTLLADAQAGLFDALKPLVFSGFDTWTASQLKLREALAARSVKVEIAETPQRSNDCQSLQCQTSTAEFEQAARWARLQLQTDPQLQIGIVVPDLAARTAEVRRIFLDVFAPEWRHRSESALPVNISYGEALANKPRVAAALGVIRLLTGTQSYQLFSLVLRTPFLEAGRGEAGLRAQLDLRLRDLLGSAFFAAEALAIADKRAPEFAAILETLEAASEDLSARDLAAWAEWITALLRKLGWPGDDTLDSVAYQELEAWNKLLADFAASAGVRGPVEWNDARQLLNRLAWNRLHQPEGDLDAVQIMGVLEAAGHAFDRLWITGMAAEDWPAARHPHPLLPFTLQRRLRIPGSSPALELEYANQITQRLATSACEVVFSWPALRDGQTLHASELIQSYPAAKKISQWQAALWPQAMFASTATKTEILTQDRPAALAPGSRARGGSRLFNLQEICPLRAFLELRLGATEIDEPATGIGYRERGSFAHDVLEDCYQKLKGSEKLDALSPDALRKDLQAMITRRMRQLPGMQRAFMRSVAELESARLLALLIEFLELEKAREPFEVIATEESHEVEVGPIKVRLKLDRVDRLANGARLVIDYKTGHVARSQWNPAKPRDMQLPLYATFTECDADGVAFAQISVHDVKLEGLGNESIAVDGIELPGALHSKFTDADGDRILDWEPLKDAWRECLLKLAQSFASGDCRINPKHSGEAEGQFAVLTRVYELPGFSGGIQNDSD